LLHQFPERIVSSGIRWFRLAECWLYSRMPSQIVRRLRCIAHISIRAGQGCNRRAVARILIYAVIEGLLSLLQVASDSVGHLDSIFRKLWTTFVIHNDWL